MVTFAAGTTTLLLGRGAKSLKESFHKLVLIQNMSGSWLGVVHFKTNFTFLETLKMALNRLSGLLEGGFKQVELGVDIIDVFATIYLNLIHFKSKSFVFLLKNGLGAEDK